MLFRILFRLLIFLLIFYLVRLVVLAVARRLAGPRTGNREHVRGSRPRDERFHYSAGEVVDARFTEVDEGAEAPEPSAGRPIREDSERKQGDETISITRGVPRR